jgi:hypothetical protein
MPVIQPARLKTQASQLVELFNQPQAFVRVLNELFENYSDRTHRPGQTGKPQALLSAYNSPPPVVRQVWLEIKPIIDANPSAALTLCDVLWIQPFLEHRILAADILGQLPLMQKTEVIHRVYSWTCAETEYRLVDTVLERGLTRIRQQSIQDLLELAQGWLSSSESTDKQLGLRLLHQLVADPSFEYLPAIFRLLSPYLRLVSSSLRPEILSILTVVIHRSPPEAAYLLRQNLTAPDNPDTPWLLRQVIDEFPDELQEGLQLALRQASHTSG